MIIDKNKLSSACHIWLQVSSKQQNKQSATIQDQSDYFWNLVPISAYGTVI